MDRSNESHFAQTPTANIARSKFERPFDLKTSFNEGQIVPIFFDQYIPGDTIKMRMSSVVRMMTPIVPVMDNASIDVYFFSVPHRILWKHTKEFYGENTTGPWTPDVEYEIPQIKAPEGGWDIGSLGAYLGEPVGVENITTSALKFRAYASIYNNWFRSEALQTPVYMHDDDATIQGINYDEDNYDAITDTEKGARLLNACKTFDYFTGCLPSAQAGEAVTVPVGTSAPILWSDSIFEKRPFGSLNPTQRTPIGKDKEVVVSGYQGNNEILNVGMRTVEGNIVPSDISTTIDGESGQLLSYRNYEQGSTIYADLSAATGATITQLRQAFAIQKFYERSAMTGQRYGSVIKGHFGVTNPDYRNMVPEYLGGFRSQITMNQVVQTSSTDATSPQGNTAAYSVTVDRKDDLFTKSFTEWGIIMGVAVLRINNHSYQQGQNREWTKKRKFDFYWPEFANLSNQAVLNKEIYAQGNDEDEQAFGYQEAWAEMRYSPDIVTGEIRADAPQSLRIWSYADYYDEKPTLSSDWIQETKDGIAHTLAVQNHNQVFGDFYFGAIWTRPLPVYSVPGLIDHH